MPKQPSIALQELMAQPREFLETYRLRIAGANAGSGVYNYFISNDGVSQRPGKLLKTHHMHSTEAFRIQPGVGANPGAHPFATYSIQMAQSNVVPIVLYTIPAGGPNIMVTGVLSGCSFIVNLGPGGLIQCAHLQPNGETGTQLNNRLNPVGYSVIYGRNSYNHQDSSNVYDRNVVIVGVRQAGQWKIYAQKQDHLNAYAIVSVNRIYP